MGSACGAEAQVQTHSPVRALSEELAALTREVACLRSLKFEANDPKSWQPAQTATVQDFVQNPLLTPLRKGNPSLGDPSILEVSGCYHLFVPCARGILHLSSTDGLSNWTASELAVHGPGAVGPFVRLLEGVVYLFYEQRGESVFILRQSSLRRLRCWRSHRLGSGVSHARCWNLSWSGRRLVSRASATLSLCTMRKPHAGSCTTRHPLLS